MLQMNPYIRFDKNCREAMAFYQSCFGGELTMQTVGESPMAAQMPKELHDRILHAQLKNESLTLMGSDLSRVDGVIKGNNITIVVVCTTPAEIETLFANLSEGGKVGHPLEKQFFGTIGDCTDRFGIDWMLQQSQQ